MDPACHVVMVCKQKTPLKLSLYTQLAGEVGDSSQEYASIHLARHKLNYAANT